MITEKHVSGDACMCDTCNPKECGCRWDEQHLWVFHCALHAAAQDLLQAAIFTVGALGERGIFAPGLEQVAMATLRAAIARAEGC